MSENMQALQGIKVAVLATDGVNEAEIVQPMEALRQAGATVTVIAPKAGGITSMMKMDKTQIIPVNKVLDDASAAEYDAVLLPGGGLNADKLRVESSAQRFVQEMDVQQKPIAVICHAPWLLISAGLVKGRRMTSFHTIKDDLVNAGADWVDQEVVTDGNWVSSRKPDDIPAFNQAMIELFKSRTNSTA